MMIIFRLALLFLVSLSSLLQGHQPQYKFEGILGNVSEIIENQNSRAFSFLPYNPTIIDIGPYEGVGTVQLAKTYPHGKIFSFEPNPRAFALLQKNVAAYKNVFPIQLAINSSTGQAPFYIHREKNNDAKLYEQHSSLLPSLSKDIAFTSDSLITVSGITLDDWCQANALGRVDFLRVDAGGSELLILENAPKSLKKAIVIVVKTHLQQLRENDALYHDLKQFLEKNDFELFAHWYCEGEQGEATFVRKIYVDSIFR